MECKGDVCQRVQADPDVKSRQDQPKFDLQVLLGESLLRKAGNSNELASTAEVISGKYTALYFSGHWCPPCRQFTPVLAKIYQIAKRTEKPLEIVFVSSDRHVGAFSEYYEEMPWAAVPFGEYNLRRGLMDTFKISGIPALVILGPDGELVNSNARSALMSDPTLSKFPWQGSTQLDSGTWSLNGLIRIAAWIILAYLLWQWAQKYFE